MAGFLFRTFVILHRYLGIAVGLLMLAWPERTSGHLWGLRRAAVSGGVCGPAADLFGWSR
jgi:hypothetical protein